MEVDQETLFDIILVRAEGGKHGVSNQKVADELLVDK